MTPFDTGRKAFKDSNGACPFYPGTRSEAEWIDGFCKAQEEAATASQAAEAQTTVETLQAEDRYAVDGAVYPDDENGPLFEGDGQYPPFVIFDIQAQENLPDRYPTREEAEKALALMLAEIGADRSDQKPAVTGLRLAETIGTGSNLFAVCVKGEDWDGSAQWLVRGDHFKDALATALGQYDDLPEEQRPDSWDGVLVGEFA